jgi:hypothetical protein
MLIVGEDMQLITVAGTTSTSNIVVIFLNDIVTSQHGELCLLQQTPELGIARISEVDGAQLGLVAYPESSC